MIFKGIGSLWWAYAAQKFTYDELPMDEQYLYKKYKRIVKAFGLNIQSNRDKYIKRFDYCNAGNPIS